MNKVITHFSATRTTPLMREILTHYYVYGDNFPRESAAISALCARFAELGLLRRLPLIPVELIQRYEANRDALQPYMEALGAIPLPVCSWAVPMRLGEKCNAIFGAMSEGLCPQCGHPRSTHTGAFV